MTVDWITAGIGLAFGALLISATVLMMRHREKLRAAAKEHGHVNVTSNDTRRSFWFSATAPPPHWTGPPPAVATAAGISDEEIATSP